MSVYKKSKLDTNEVLLNSLLDKSVKYISKNTDVKNWEMYGNVSQSGNVSIENGFLKDSQISQASAITFSVFGKNGNVGSACITRLSESHILKTIDQAISLMKVSASNDEFKGLAYPADKYPDFKVVWDPQIQNLTIEETSDIIDEIIDQKHRDDKIKAISGGVGYGDSRMQVCNSNGINLKDKGTSASIWIEMTFEEIVKENKQNSSGFYAQAYKEFKSIETDVIFDKAYQKGLKGLKKITVESKDYPVILSPHAVELLFAASIIGGINAEAIYQKRSFLMEKIGEKIANESLTIKDDPWLKGGLSSESFDCEGTPTKPIKIVEDGILNTIFHNTYTANLFDTESNGHAARSAYSPAIGISSSNVIIETGDMNLDDMISDIKEGIYFDYSYDSPKIETGDFSGLITGGYLIKDGAICEGLKETLLGINLLDLYQKIIGISKESERIYSDYYPHILTSEIKISGAK